MARAPDANISATAAGLMYGLASADASDTLITAVASAAMRKGAPKDLAGAATEDEDPSEAQRLTKRIEDIDDKQDFVNFLKMACANRQTPEFNELYRFLLSVFQRCDRDFDGLVRAEDFDIMVEMAGAIPRKFAFAPSSLESFASDDERMRYRKNAFAKINASGTGAISFDEWLNYSYQHICEMTATLDEKKADLGMSSKERFKEWCIKACRDRQSPEYKELYNLLLSTFMSGDKDMDGKVNVWEFDAMVEAAAAYPRKFGYAPPSS